MDYIRKLRQAGAAERFGGKAANLGVMLRAGINVPDGFVVTTAAYQKYKPQVSEDFARQLLQAFDALGAKRVAVRSSAVAEDSANASWAGQLDTILNVTRNDLVKAVEACWASMQSEQAQTYASGHQVTADQQAVAVVVQMMVDSDVSGVLFTANPVSNDRSEIVVESIYGLGELLVQGQATPDNFIIDKATGIVKSQTPHRQKTKLVYKAGKNQTVRLMASEKAARTLTDKQLARLVQEAIKIEVHYGRPQDLEWAFYKGQLFLIQARPITTLAAANQQSIVDDFLQDLGSDKLMRIEGDFMPFQLMIEWWNSYDDQQLPEQIYPVLFYFSKNRTSGYLSHDKYRGIAVKAFQQLVAGERSLETIEAGYQASKTAVQMAYDAYFLKPQKPAAEAALLQRFRALHQEFQVLVAWTLFYEQLDESAVAQVLAAKNYDLPKIWELVKLPIFPSFDTRKKQLQLTVLEGSKPPAYIAYALSDYTFLADEAFIVKTLASTNVEALQKSIDRTTVANAKAQQQLETGLQQLSAAEAQVVRILQWVLRNRDDRKFTINQLEILLYRLGQQLFKTWGLNTKYLSQIGISEVLQGKQHVTALVKDLPKRSKGFSVLYRSDNPARIGYQQLASQIKRLDRIIVKQTTSKNASSLSGEVGNVGQATGQVHVIRKRSEFDSFKPGEILVTGMTRPEFVPLMERAAAIVTDEGGITAHAAIVAREMGKPCVIGTRVATQVLKTGTLVEVDASRGVVTILG